MKIDKLRKWLMGWCPKEVPISKEKAPITQSLLRPTHLATWLSLTAAVVMMSIIYVGFTQEYIGLHVFPFLLWGTHGAVYSWARKVVNSGQTVSRIRVFSALFLLYLASAASVAWYAYSSPLSLFLNWVYKLIMVSVLSLFPAYTLLKRKLIPDRTFLLTFLVFFIPNIISFLSIDWRKGNYTSGDLPGMAAFALLSLMLIGSLAINHIKKRKSPYSQRDPSRSSSRVIRGLEI